MGIFGSNTVTLETKTGYIQENMVILIKIRSYCEQMMECSCHINGKYEITFKVSFFKLKKTRKIAIEEKNSLESQILFMIFTELAKRPIQSMSCYIRGQNSVPLNGIFFKGLLSFAPPYPIISVSVCFCACLSVLFRFCQFWSNSFRF